MEVAPFFVNFHHFLSIFTIFYRFSRFTHFCRDLRTFSAIFFAQNSLLRNITRFLHVCLEPWKTIQTDLGRAGISKNVTDRQNLPIIYRFHLVPPTSPPRNPPDPPRPPELPWPPMLLPWICVWLYVYQSDFISQAINSSSHCTWPPCPGRGEPLPWAPKWLISFSNLCLLWCSLSPKMFSLDNMQADM